MSQPAKSSKSAAASSQASGADDNFASGVRLLVPRAGGRVIARFTTMLMLLVMGTPNEVYLPAIAIAVAWVALAAGWAGSEKLPLGIGRICGQLREHLFRVTADWLTVAGYLFIGLLWTFLTPRPGWLNALPVALTAFACWTAQFAALPPGAMSRWVSFQWMLLNDMIGNPFRKKAEAESTAPTAAAPAPTPVNPFEATTWPSRQQERFDDWLAEEVNRFKAEEATPTDAHEEPEAAFDNPASTQQLAGLAVNPSPTAGASPHSAEAEAEDSAAEERPDAEADAAPETPADNDEPPQPAKKGLPSVGKIKKLK